MKIVKMPLAKIRPAAYNPRKALEPTDREYQALRRSMQEFGAVEPLIVNKRTGNLVGGHQRLQILKDLGEKTVDVVEVDLDPKREKALNVALNKITGRWDKHKLKDLLVDLDDGGLDIELTGFEEDELKKLVDEEDADAPSDDDRVPPRRKKANTKLGDLYELDGHRILCGDSTKPEDVRRLTRGELASAIFTDPPYGVDYRSRSETQDFAPIQGDEKRSDDLLRKLLVPAFQNAVQAAHDTAAFYIWHASSTREDFAAAMKAVGLEERQYLIWAKNNFVMGHADYHWAHEPCFYASKAGQRPQFYGDRTNQTVWTASLDLRRAQDKSLLTNVANGVLLMDGRGGQLFIQARAPKGKKARRIRVEQGAPVFLHHDGADQSVWTVAKDPRIEHPTQKPVELAIRALENSTKPEEVVLDLFLGSGCTLIGAERTGRKCYAMELDPVYVDQAVERWEALTGKKAFKTQGEKP